MSAEAVPEVDVETRVRAVLATHGLLDRVSEEELGVFVDIYPHIREAADKIWIPEAEYEEMALVFDPTAGTQEAPSRVPGGWTR